MHRRVARAVNRHGAILYGVGCVGLGIFIDQLIHQGWAPLALGLAVLFSKWVFKMVGETFFADEMRVLKDYIDISADPVKKIIWRVHRRDRHRLRFRDCPHPDCAPYN